VDRRPTVGAMGWAAFFPDERECRSVHCGQAFAAFANTTGTARPREPSELLFLKVEDSLLQKRELSAYQVGHPLERVQLLPAGLVCGSYGHGRGAMRFGPLPVQVEAEDDASEDDFDEPPTAPQGGPPRAPRLPRRVLRQAVTTTAVMGTEHLTPSPSLSSADADADAFPTDLRRSTPHSLPASLSMPLFAAMAINMASISDGTGKQLAPRERAPPSRMNGVRDEDAWCSPAYALVQNRRPHSRRCLRQTV